MYIKPERYNPPRGNDGYHLTKSKTNIKGGTIIRPIFHFCTFFKRCTIPVGVTDVFSLFNRLHFEYQSVSLVLKETPKGKMIPKKKLVNIIVTGD